LLKNPEWECTSLLVRFFMLTAGVSYECIRIFTRRAFLFPVGEEHQREAKGVKM